MNQKYIDRSSNTLIDEKTPGLKLLNWLYLHKSGNLFLELLVKRKFLSILYGKMQDLKISRNKIKKFIAEYNIDMSLFQETDPEKFKSFNDFFARKLDMSKRNIDMNPSSLISPADSKALFLESIEDDAEFNIKGFDFTLSKLLDNKYLYDKYRGGSLAIFRLAPSDYHRYHFIDRCSVLTDDLIEGDYYSVHPIAVSKVNELYSKNKREISVLKTENFGDVAYIEVGATFVGSIVQTYGQKHNSNDDNEKTEHIETEQTQLNFEKGSEKGYFKFGGSTVILIFEKDKVAFDKDLVENTENGLETYVFMGEKIGLKVTQ